MFVGSSCPIAGEGGRHPTEATKPSSSQSVTESFVGNGRAWLGIRSAACVAGASYWGEGCYLSPILASIPFVTVAKRAPPKSSSANPCM